MKITFQLAVMLRNFRDKLHILFGFIFSSFLLAISYCKEKQQHYFALEIGY